MQAYLSNRLGADPRMDLSKIALLELASALREGGDFRLKNVPSSIHAGVYAHGRCHRKRRRDGGGRCRNGEGYSREDITLADAVGLEDSW